MIHRLRIQCWISLWVPRGMKTPCPVITDQSAWKGRRDWNAGRYTALMFRLTWIQDERKQQVGLPVDFVAGFFELVGTTPTVRAIRTHSLARCSLGLPTTTNGRSTRAEVQQVQPNRSQDLCENPRVSSLQTQFLKQHIGRRRHQLTQLVRQEAGATGAVNLKPLFKFLDRFSASPRAQ